MDSIKLYKYRSLKDFDLFLDIILNKRLYAATYKDMNDAMEGVYFNYGLEINKKKEIKRGKGQLRICSLSKAANNPLLWAHYANGSRGVNIELEVDKDSYQIIPIQYDGIPVIEEFLDGKRTAREILSHKHESWRYEEERRVFTVEQFVYIKIRRIILGERISDFHKNLIKSIVSLLCSDNIEVVEYKEFKKELKSNNLSSKS